jgi:hypothetical protein
MKGEIVSSVQQINVALVTCYPDVRARGASS